MPKYEPAQNYPAVHSMLWSDGNDIRGVEQSKVLVEKGAVIRWRGSTSTTFCHSSSVPHPVIRSMNVCVLERKQRD